MGTVPQVRAVVVTWNGAHLLPACLASLSRQAGPFALEILVVDNASSDDTDGVVRAVCPSAALVRTERNLGFAGGARVGTHGYAGDFLLLLNNDATLAPDALARMVEVMTDPQNDRVGAVTAKILLDGWFLETPAAQGDVPPGAFRRGSVWLVPAAAGTPGAVRVVNSTGNVVTRDGAGVDRDWLATDGTQTADRDVLGFSGGAALLRRSALQEVGGFDADLFLYYEDTDVSLKMRAAGWQIAHLPTALAKHRHAATSDASSPLFRYYNTRNSLIVMGRHAPVGVVVRSVVRQLLGWGRSALRRREPAAVRAARGRGLRDALVRTPRTCRERRRIWRGAPTSRREVARYIV